MSEEDQEITASQVTGVLLSMASSAVEYVQQPGVYEAFTAWLAGQDTENIIPKPHHLRHAEIYLLLQSGTKLGILEPSIQEAMRHLRESLAARRQGGKS